MMGGVELSPVDVPVALWGQGWALLWCLPGLCRCYLHTSAPACDLACWQYVTNHLVFSTRPGAIREDIKTCIWRSCQFPPGEGGTLCSPRLGEVPHKPCLLQVNRNQLVLSFYPPSLPSLLSISFHSLPYFPPFLPSDLQTVQFYHYETGLT